MGSYSTPPERAPSEREVRRGRATVPLPWIVMPIAIVIVLAIGFGLRAIL